MRATLVLLGLLLGAALTACGSEPAPDLPTMTTTTAATSEQPSTVEAPPTTAPATTTAQAVTTSPPGSRLPAALVGEWSASSSATGALELVLAADGTYRHYDGKSVDWRGKVTVRGSRITFHRADGTTDTYDWSLNGGTLALNGLTYLKASAGAGGQLAFVGTWMGMDDIYETLVFHDSGTYQRRHDAHGTVNGTFQVQGTSLTLRPTTGVTITATWSVRNGILTLRTSEGRTMQYSRSS